MIKDVLGNVVKIIFCFVICFAFQIIVTFILMSYYENGQDASWFFGHLFRIVVSIGAGIFVIGFNLNNNLNNSLVEWLILLLFGYLMFLVPILSPIGRMLAEEGILADLLQLR